MDNQDKREVPVTPPACPAKFNKAWMRRDEVSLYLLERWGISRTTATLAKYSTTGGGPPFVKRGKTPFYSRQEVDEWVASITEVPKQFC